MKRTAILAFAAACGGGTAPSTKAPTGARGPAPVAPIAPVARIATPVHKLSPGEVLKALHELGVRKRDELVAVPQLDLPVIGACTRPTEAERAAIRERVLAWVTRQTPRERDARDGSTLQLRFGCVEPAGIVVDAQVDRFSARGRETPDVGHWWTLRVSPGAIAPLAAVNGIAMTSFMEWATEHTLATVALADLDRDGTLDPLVAEVTSEGGSQRADITLSLVRSRTGVAQRIAELGDDVELAGGAAAGPVVLRIRDHDGTRYRCIDTPLALASCPEAEAARHRDRAIELAELLVGANHVPDRDQLTEVLATLAIATEQQAPLLASAPATTDAERVTRAIAAFAGPVDNRTNRERAADARRVGESQLADVRGELGDAPCAARVDDAAIRTAIRTRSPVAKNIQIVDRCGGVRDGYGLATWELANQRVEGVFHVRSGRAAQLLVTAAQPDTGDPTAPPPRTIEAGFYTRGDKTLAVVVENGVVMEAFANGASVGRVRGTFSWVSFEDTRSDLVHDVADPDHPRVLHATDREIALATSPRAAEYMRRASARQTLKIVDPQLLASPGYRAELAAALALLGADPALVADVQRLR